MERIGALLVCGVSHSVLDASLPCTHDAECLGENELCIKGSCLPRCIDADGAPTTAGQIDTVQITTPGTTSGFFAHAGPQQQLIWQAITMSDGCKNAKLLLEYYCAPFGVSGSQLQFTYVSCPEGTVCQASTDVTTNITAAACVPEPALETAPLLNCPVGQLLAWQSLPAPPSMAPMPMETLQVHGGALYAGGIGGVQRWDSLAATWMSQNDGFGPVNWLTVPMIIALQSHQNALYAVQVNGSVEQLYRSDSVNSPWIPVVDAPLKLRSLLTDNGLLYLGSADAVTAYQTLDTTWTALGAGFSSMVSALHMDDGILLAGTATGEIFRYEGASAVWASTANAMNLQFIRAMQRFGEYLYVGGDAQLYRCWDQLTQCEPIEPETGFPAGLTPLAFLALSNALFAATPKGVYQLSAEDDTWTPVNAGLTGVGGVPLHTTSLAWYQNHLVAGTLSGVYQYVCTW